MPFLLLSWLWWSLHYLWHYHFISYFSVLLRATLWTLNFRGWSTFGPELNISVLKSFYIHGYQQVESAEPCQVTSPTTSEGCVYETVKDKPADQISSRDEEENAAHACNLERSPNEETANLMISTSKKKHGKKAVKPSIDKLEVRFSGGPMCSSIWSSSTLINICYSILDDWFLFWSIRKYSLPALRFLARDHILSSESYHVGLTIRKRKLFKRIIKRKLKNAKKYKEKKIAYHLGEKIFFAG